ncbi:reverse transcriptase domain-containing protein [Tanacetum coccineum]
MKVNGVSDDAFRLHLFPYSLQDHAAEWFDRLPRNSINSFDQMAKIFLGKYFPPSMVTKLRNNITNFRQRPDESLFEASAGGTFMKRRPKECYDLIENMTAHHNDWDTFVQPNESSSSITSSNPEIAPLKLQMEEMNRNLTRVLQTNQQVNTVTPSCETCGGPHSYNDCPATVGQNQNVYAVGTYNQGGYSYQPQGHGFFVISISSDLSEESVGTSTARVILFGTIPATISSTASTIDLPIIHDDTPLIHPLSHPLYPLYHLLLPLFSTLPHSFALTHLTVTPLIHYHRYTRHLIPVGRPYRTQPNGVLQMLTARKRVRPLPTHRLALRYSVDYSSSDQFTSDDSSRDSHSDFSSKTSSDSHLDFSSLRHSS